MRNALIVTLHIPMVLAAIIGWAMVDWTGTQNGGILLVASIIALLGTVTWRLARNPTFFVLPALTTAILLACTVFDVSPVQPAARAARRIEVGMTQVQVRRVLREEFPLRLRPTGMNLPLRNDALVFALGTSGRYDAAVLDVRFAKGRVVSSTFLSD